MRTKRTPATRKRHESIKTPTTAKLARASQPHQRKSVGGVIIVFSAGAVLLRKHRCSEWSEVVSEPDRGFCETVIIECIESTILVDFFKLCPGPTRLATCAIRFLRIAH